MADKRERGYYWIIQKGMEPSIAKWEPARFAVSVWLVDNGKCIEDDQVEVLSERLVLQKADKVEQDKFVEGLRSKLIISLLCKALDDGGIDPSREVALSFDLLDRQLLEYDLKMRIDMDGKALVLGLTPKG